MPLFNFYRTDNRAFITAQTADNAKKALEAAVAAGVNLSFADLSGLDLTNANLKGAALTSAKLDGSVLDAVHLEGATLTNASLQNIQHKASDFYSKMSLRGATVTNMKTTGSPTGRWEGF